MLTLFLMLQTLWVCLDSALFFGGVAVLKSLQLSNVSTYQLIQLLPFLTLPFILKKARYSIILGISGLCKLVAVAALWASQPILGFVALGVSMALFNPLRYVISEYWNTVELRKMASLEGLTFLGMLSGVLLGGAILWDSITWLVIIVLTICQTGGLWWCCIRPLPQDTIKMVSLVHLLKDRFVLKSLLGTSLFFGIAGLLKSLIVMMVSQVSLINSAGLSSKIIVMSNICVILGVFLAKYVFYKFPKLPIGFGIPIGLTMMLFSLNPLSWLFLAGLNILAFSAGLFFVKYNFDLHDFSSGNNVTYSLFVFQNFLENASAIFFLLLLSIFGVSYVVYFLSLITGIALWIVLFLNTKNPEIFYAAD